MYTGCFINSVTILNLCIIKISTLIFLTSKYYKNIMICILFGKKIDPHFNNLGLLYENLKRYSFYDVFKMTSPSEFSKQKGSMIPS